MTLVRTGSGEWFVASRDCLCQDIRYWASRSEITGRFEATPARAVTSYYNTTILVTRNLKRQCFFISRYLYLYYLIEVFIVDVESYRQHFVIHVVPQIANFSWTGEQRQSRVVHHSRLTSRIRKVGEKECELMLEKPIIMCNIFVMHHVVKSDSYASRKYITYLSHSKGFTTLDETWGDYTYLPMDKTMLKF